MRPDSGRKLAHIIFSKSILCVRRKIVTENIVLFVVFSFFNWKNDSFLVLQELRNFSEKSMSFKNVQRW